MIYFDRLDAGQQLAQKLARFEGSDVVILALPRGGVVLGVEVAKELEAPLGLVLVRKIGHPAYPEYAIGAVAEDEMPIYNEDELTGIDSGWLKQANAAASQLNKQRRAMYFGSDYIPPSITNKTVIIVDDGIATGLTMEAAVRAIQNKHANRIIIAVPVASLESIHRLEGLADEIIILEDPRTFRGSVGAHYQQFEPVDDKEVQSLLWEVNSNVQATTTNKI
jgi:predicted phosphoribosyltransferase